MRTLSLSPGMPYFVSKFNAHACPPSLSTRAFGATVLLPAGGPSPVRVKEGGANFEIMVAAMLRDVDRHLHLAVANTWSGARLLTASASYWAHVSLYYGAFFSAKAILGILGAWFEPYNMVLENVTDAPGRQEWEASRAPRGSHAAFWTEYFATSAHLAQWLPDPALRPAVLAGARGDTWLSETRNRYNYVPADAFQHMSDMRALPAGSQLPKDLQGDALEQFRVTDAMLRYALWLADDVKLATDVHAPSRVSVVRDQILKSSPASVDPYLADLEKAVV